MLRDAYPNEALHVLIRDNAVPVLKHIPWIHKVWGTPKNFWRNLSLVRTLRTVGFSRSIDFAGNDRGALMSRAVGAPERLGACPLPSPWWRRACYTTCLEPIDITRHESIRLAQLLSAWKVPFTDNLKPEIVANPELVRKTQTLLPPNAIVCHLTASQPKKEWPLTHWQRVHAHFRQHNVPLVFSAGVSDRERTLLEQFSKIASDAHLLPAGDLETFIALLSHARLLVAPDTGTLHLAAGLGVPTLGLFGPTPPSAWAPVGHAYLTGGVCPCSGHTHVCHLPTPCIAHITPEQVVENIERMLA